MQHYIINSPQVISEEVAGETVIINLETGTYYNLNEDASKVWAPFVVGVDVDNLKSKVPASGAKKLDEFVAKLLSEGLIKEAPSSTAIQNDIAVDMDKVVLEIYTDMQDLLGLDPIHEVSTEAGWPKKAAQ